MPFSIAFVGVDGAGKTTLINKTLGTLDWFVVSHQIKVMRLFYHHQKSPFWELINLLECVIQNWVWKQRLKKGISIFMDRCYICALVYSEIEGYPQIAGELTKYASTPDIVVLLEPVEELVPRAYEFTRQYKKTLKDEGYLCFKRGNHLFGRVTFWKKPEIVVTPLLKYYTDVIGSI